MRYIGNSKISKIHPKPNTSYPLLRLPQAFNEFIGDTTHIFETDHDGKQAFLVIPDKNDDDAQQVNPQVMQPVMQPEAEVTQKHSENDVKNRLLKLESEIDAIKKFIYRIADTSNGKTTNKALELKQTPRACGLAGYDVAFTRRRSGVRIAPSPSFFSLFSGIIIVIL